jgi:putative glutamine amidotransferase
VVEAIESAVDDWFALGVQFHPEEDRGTKLDICVFEQLMLGIRRSRKLRKAG